MYMHIHMYVLVCEYKSGVSETCESPLLVVKLNRKKIYIIISKDIYTQHSNKHFNT